MATYKLQYLIVGALMRGEVKRFFRDVEMRGGVVTYNEHKALFETTFTHIRITGDNQLIRDVHSVFSQIIEE